MASAPPITAAGKLQAGKLSYVKLSELTIDPGNPRKAFDEGALKALAANIKVAGIKVPLLVRREASVKVYIQDGERRYRAAKSIKLASVPVILQEEYLHAADVRLGQIALNDLRASLTPLERAETLRQLRDDAKLTVSDIAAWLDRNGMGLMKPADIKALIELTGLPAWAKDLVNAGTMEISAAAQLLDVLQRPEVLKVAKARIERDIQWRGRVTAKEVREAIVVGFHEHHIDLQRTQEYLGDQAVRFDWRKQCAKCEFLSKIGGAWCLNKKLFATHQAEAKAAGLGPGGKRPEKAKQPSAKAEEKAAEQKAEQRERSLTDKARDYLHAYLARALMPRIPGSPLTEYALVVWAALGRPGANHGRGAPGVLFADGAGTAADSQEIEALETLLGSSEVIGDGRAAAAQEILCNLPWRETLALTRHLLGDDLAAAWKPDEAFLDLFRKADLAHLATHHAIDLPEGRRSWDALKGAEIKAAILAQPGKITHPQILVDLYSTVEKPFIRWSHRQLEGGDGDEDDDGLDDEGGEE